MANFFAADGFTLDGAIDLSSLWNTAATTQANNSYIVDKSAGDVEVSGVQASTAPASAPRNDWSSFWQAQTATIIGAVVAKETASTPGGQAGQGGNMPATTTPATSQVQRQGIPLWLLIGAGLLAYVATRKA